MFVLLKELGLTVRWALSIPATKIMNTQEVFLSKSSREVDTDLPTGFHQKLQHPFIWSINLLDPSFVHEQHGKQIWKIWFLNYAWHAKAVNALKLGS